MARAYTRIPRPFPWSLVRRCSGGCRAPDGPVDTRKARGEGRGNWGAIDRSIGSPSSIRYDRGKFSHLSDDPASQHRSR